MWLLVECMRKKVTIHRSIWNIIIFISHILLYFGTVFHCVKEKRASIFDSIVDTYVSVHFEPQYIYIFQILFFTYVHINSKGFFYLTLKPFTH